MTFGWFDWTIHATPLPLPMLADGLSGNCVMLTHLMFGVPRVQFKTLY